MCQDRVTCGAKVPAGARFPPHGPRTGHRDVSLRHPTLIAIWGDCLVVWVTALKSLAFNIEPSFWQTMWFTQISVGLLVAGTAGVAWWLAHRRHRRARQKLERAHEFSVALVKLSLSPIVTSDDRGEAFAAITESAANTMGVERVGIWVFHDSGRRLRCVDLYRASTQAHERGASLEMSSYPRYFDAINRERVVVASDAVRNAGTSELATGYLASLGISSMLDAAIRVGGRLVGVICHEHVGPAREWTEDEIAFAGSVADFAAQVILNSDHRQAIRDLSESEQRMSMAADAAHLGMWLWQIPANRIWATDTFRELYALPVDGEITFEAFLERIHPQDRDGISKDVLDALASDHQFEAEYRLLLRGSGVRWISSRGRVERDGAGVPMRMQGVSIDITQRRLAEERFRLTVEASGTAMIMIGQGGRILLVNRQTEKVFGYDRSELIDKSIEVLIPDRHLRPHRQRREAIADLPEARLMRADQEVFGRRKDGSEVALEVALNPIDTTEGGFVLASIIDVTWRRQAEADAARQRNELAHLSRVNLLGELSGSLAHELNQPLMAILSNAQAAQRYLERGDFDIDELREILKDIVSEDRRAGEVIHRLRLLLKKGQVQQHRLQANEVVEEVLKLVHSDLIHHDVTVETDLASNLPVVNGDRVQLQQVVLNLVINACDAMNNVPREDRKLLLRTLLSQDGHTLVRVSDRGCGIAPDKLESVFEPFYSTKPQGMGLGLAVCRTIIAAHAGRLWVTNNSDRGVTFHVALPAIADGRHD